MDTKLCRTCGRSGQNFVHIFKTEGLKNKIETCLPITVSQHCLLPDTLCPECLLSIEKFYSFTKNCLESILILESQLDIQESCLKANRRKEKSCLVSLPLAYENKYVQTEDYLNILLGGSVDLEGSTADFPLTSKFLTEEKYNHSKWLVDYDVRSESNSSDNDESDARCGQVILGEKLQSLQLINNIVNSIITSKTITNKGFINDRKNSQKRKNDSIESRSTKICRIESANKRKCSKPKKLEKSIASNSEVSEKCFEVAEIKKELKYDDIEEENRDVGTNGGSEDEGQAEDQECNMPQCCLLCNAELPSPASLAEHFMKVHTREAVQPNIESSNCESGEERTEKKRRSIPSLVKISDLKRSESFEESPISDHHTEDDTTCHQKITCPNCQTVFSTKTELFVHLRLNHSEISTFLCGICLKQTNSAANLRTHVLNCFKLRSVTNRYFCQVCCFGEDNYRSMESHVLVHNFLWKNCQKEMKNFDPEDYIEKNPHFHVNSASPIKNFSCLECSRSDFDTFRKFSVHRRNVHSIFHCDLCNKFYGRNSHLWKHVNRLHKNHPSVTCQVCFKTSASKYHLAQHFAKIHQVKTTLRKDDCCEDSQEKVEKTEEFQVDKKRVIFRKQDSTDQENPNTSCDENSLNQSSQSDNENSTDHNVAPKEIDPSHDLYTNILTNYTPPKNEGDYKCPKCSKGFHKRMLLRKHKKNCRPKLQKDLLTRCKTCARIFKDRQSLAKHLTNYHSDYECEICKEKVPSKCEIVSHIRFQHPSSHLICSVCENILRCKKDLLDHLADHESSFVCQFCGDALASKVKLKMHILSLHRKILSLSCGICLKLFETQQVLRNHVTLIHKDQLVPLISCPVCGKNYGSKWKTFDHVNKSHGRFFKACKICLEIYETESQLDSHMITAHNNQPVTSNIASKPNPVSILRPPLKSEDPRLNLDHIENNFDTDSEENTEETENSQTSESEEEENNGSHMAEEQKRHSEESLPSYPTQDHKMSLLEKRLLGKAFTQNEMLFEKNYTGNSYILCLANNAVAANKPAGGEFTKEKSVSPKIKREDENSFPIKKTDNGNHHSKRTVYENSNDPSFCEICHKTWPAKKHLWQHYIRCHKRVAATVCGICLKTNNSYEALQVHLRETHPNLLHGQGYGSNFICRICGRYHNASSKLRLHMVIHEKFDWSLLEKFPSVVKSDLRNLKENETQHSGTGNIVNGDEAKYEQGKIKEEIVVLNGEEEIYDAMIEQVEESTTSTDIETGHKTQDSSSDSEDTVHVSKPEGGQGIDNRLSFSNLLQTLKNHNQFQVLNQIHQKTTPAGTNNLQHFRVQSVIQMRQGSNVSSNTVAEKQQDVGQSYLSEESSSSVIEDGEGDGNSQNPVNCVKGERCEENGQHQKGNCSSEDNAAYGDHYYSRNIFRPKPGELDSAIKSISDPCNELQMKTEFSDFNESMQQGNCLNETEIESAVGSIL